MAALLDKVPASGGYMSVKATGAYAGISKQAVFGAIARGRLHPVHIPGLSYRVFFRGEVLAWHHRLLWRPTPEEMAALLAEGYKAEDFTPAPDEAPTPPAGAGGASDASGAFVSPVDILAAMQHYMRESQALTASVAPVVGSATESAMRGWREATGASASPSDVADITARITESAVRPIAETIRENIAPLSEALAQAATPRPTPPAEDDIARHMAALRVELAHVLTRLLDAMRPMIARLVSGEYITAEDAAPMIGLMGELAAQLADSPLYTLAPRDVAAQLPGIVEQYRAQAASTSPAPHDPPGSPTSGEAHKG